MKRTAAIDVQSLNSRVMRIGFWVYPTLLLIVAGVSRFAILSNDSFPLEWQACHLSVYDPVSFFNGFFPIGYPLLLWIAAIFGNPYTSLEILQILLVGIYFRKIWTFTQPILGSIIAPIAVIFIVFSPELVRAELSTVPDFLAALFVLLAIVGIIRDDRQFDRRAGLYLGIGLLLRTHVLVFIVAILVAIIIIQWRTGVQRAAIIFVSVIPFLTFQGLIQLWSGHGFFENMQSFNVWKAMHGIDWTNPPSHFSATIPQVISAEPLLFFHTYLSLLGDILYLIIPLFAFLAIAIWKREICKPLTILVLAALLYLLIVTAGGSARSIVLVLPIVITSIFAIIQFILPEASLLKIGGRVATMLLAVLILIGSTAMFLGARHAAERVMTYNELQTTLRLSVPSEENMVYSDDFALYFPALRDLVPRTNGGWAELGLPEYLQQYPHMSDSTSEAFYIALKQNHIRFVVLRNPPANIRVQDDAKKGYCSFCEDSL